MGHSGGGVFIIIEQQNRVLADVNYELLFAGRQLADALDVTLFAVLLDDKEAAHAATLFRHGAHGVIVANPPVSPHGADGVRTQLLLVAVRRYAPHSVLFSGSLPMRELARRFADSLGSDLVANCNKLEIVPQNGRLLMQCPDGTRVLSQCRPQPASILPGAFPKSCGGYPALGKTEFIRIAE